VLVAEHPRHSGDGLGEIHTHPYKRNIGVESNKSTLSWRGWGGSVAQGRDLEWASLVPETLSSALVPERPVSAPPLPFLVSRRDT
jgi:hypothetical protein